MAAKRKQRLSSVKLNLMPPYIAAARKVKAATIATVVLVLLILGAMGIWWRSNAAQIARLNEELQQKSAEASKVKELEDKASRIRSEVQDITTALTILDDIRNSGKEWMGLLLKIREWIPEDVRLTSLTLQGGPTNAQSVVLTGYTTSLRKLRDFYSQLSQSALFTNVQLQYVEKNGAPIPVTGLPPVVPKPPEKPKVGAELGQPSPSGASPAGPGMAPGGAGAPGIPPGAMAGPQAMGAHEPTGGTGARGMPSEASTGPEPMGMPSGAMPGAPGMGAMPPMMGGPMMGGPMFGAGQQQVPIVRDPTAPRNAVYFAIVATLAQPVQVAKSLQPPQPATGMPLGGMPQMGPAVSMGPEAARAEGAAPPTPPEAERGETGGRLGRRRGLGGEEM